LKNPTKLLIFSHSSKKNPVAKPGRWRGAGQKGSVCVHKQVIHRNLGLQDTTMGVGSHAIGGNHHQLQCLPGLGGLPENLDFPTKRGLIFAAYDVFSGGVLDFAKVDGAVPPVNDEIDLSFAAL
jgi:hypothetical protein